MNEPINVPSSPSHDQPSGMPWEGPGVSSEMVPEDAKKGAFGKPIPAEDIASDMMKDFGIGKGDGGPGGHV
jgi:hypothetical protein